MKKIFLIAYINNNLGDDLFVRTICDRYPNYQFYLSVTSKYASNFSKIKNLQIIKIPLVIKKLEATLKRLNISISPTFLIEKKILRLCDATVYIGGSVFIENSNPRIWKFDVNKIKNIKKITRKLFFIGANFGPYLTSDYLKTHVELFNSSEGIVVRDSNSYKLLKNNGVSKLKLAPDVVFTLGKKVVNGSENNNVHKKYCLISAIDLNYSQRKMNGSIINEYKENIRKIIDFNSQKGIESVLVSFCDRQGDLKFIEELISELDLNQQSHTRSVNYSGNLDEIIELYKNASYVISTRFHSMILANIFMKPNFTFSYSSKTKDVLDDMKFSESYIELNDEINSFEIDKIINKLPIPEEKIILDLVKNSEEQFYFFDEMVRDEK